MTEVKLPKNRMNGDTEVIAGADTPKTRSDVPLPSPLQEVETVPRGKGTGRRSEPDPHDESGPDDDTAEIPFIGRIGGKFLSRLDKLSIGVLVILIVSGFGAATMVWAADHVGEPLIQAEVKAKEKLTDAAVRKDDAITENQNRLTLVIGQLVATVESQHQERVRSETQFREVMRNSIVALQINHDDSVEIKQALARLTTAIERNTKDK